MKCISVIDHIIEENLKNFKGIKSKKSSPELGLKKKTLSEILNDPIYLNPNVCWAKLRGKYPTKGSYKRRQVILNYQSEKEHLTNWLVDLGFDVTFSPNADEEIRFKKDGLLGIIYCTGTGNLLAHEVCELYNSK